MSGIHNGSLMQLQPKPGVLPSENGILEGGWLAWQTNGVSEAAESNTFDL